MSIYEQKDMRQNDAGFTLVELLVVLVILGLIIGIVAPQAMKYVGSSRVKTAHIQLERISTILDLFHLDAGRYPTSEEGLEALINKPPEIETWNGPYIRRADAIIDPWANPFEYIYPGEHADFDLVSFGADGRQGGEGQDADINSWN